MTNIALNFAISKPMVWPPDVVASSRLSEIMPIQVACGLRGVDLVRVPCPLQELRI